MDPLTIALVTSTGAILAAWITGPMAKRWVERRAAERREALAEVEQAREDRAQWESLVNQWRTDVRELRAMRAEDKRVYDAEIRECRSRIEQLERDRAQDRERIRQLVDDLIVLAAWARSVVALLQSHNITFPAVPIDLDREI